MGGASCLFLAMAGVRIVGIVDSDGIVTDAEGLDIEQLLAHRDHFGRIDRNNLPNGAQTQDGSGWLSIDCELLIPAAVSSCITVENQKDVVAQLIVEASNLPITQEAEALLAARGITVIPDFLANSATNAWWWLRLFGDIDGTWEQSEQKIRARLDELTLEILNSAKALKVTPREAAIEVSRSNLEKLLKTEGAR
jgi:glutamate dehydrogenase (NAD(P)+)